MRIAPFLCLLGLLASAGLARADDPLPKNVAEAKAMEAADTLPLTPFYDPPRPLPPAPPGTLIRSESFAGYTLPKGARAIRFLYHSRTIAGADVAASGVVLLPAGPRPKGGWPVIAWAHGTSGVARICAPSLMKDVEYGEEGLMPMVRAGFAVIAPDYAGLGTPGPHQYDDKLAQANDMVYAVPAARAAVPGLARKWAVIGHSQGGVAVWGVAELEAKLRDPDYVGGVSVAGDMDYVASERHDMKTLDPSESLYWPYVAFGIKASYPSFEIARMLTPLGLEHYRDVTTNGCWYYGYATMKALGPRPIVRPGWLEIPEAKRYNADSRSADKPIRGPLLIVAGDDDMSVWIVNIRKGVREACRHRLPIEFRHYPGLDHDPLMEKTTPDQLAWVRARLAGVPWKSSCAAAAPG